MFTRAAGSLQLLYYSMGSFTPWVGSSTRLCVWHFVAYSWLKHHAQLFIIQGLSMLFDHVPLDFLVVFCSFHESQTQFERKRLSRSMTKSTQSMFRLVQTYHVNRSTETYLCASGCTLKLHVAAVLLDNMILSSLSTVTMSKVIVFCAVSTALL